MTAVQFTAEAVPFQSGIFILSMIAVRLRAEALPSQSSPIAAFSGRDANLGGVEIAEAVHFGGAEESEINASGLQQSHDAEHIQALGGAEDVRRIGHGVNQFGR